MCTVLTCVFYLNSPALFPYTSLLEERQPLLLLNCKYYNHLKKSSNLSVLDRKPIEAAA